MEHKVIIETHRLGGGRWRAHVVSGPKWAVGWSAEDYIQRCAVLTLQQDLSNERPRDIFTFIHAEG